MSEERVILALLMQEIGWVTDPYSIDADKVTAILNQHAESQNRALQRRIEDAGLECGRLRDALWHEWQSNHSEHCDVIWPHGAGDTCHYPLLDLLRPTQEIDQ